MCDDWRMFTALTVSSLSTTFCREEVNILLVFNNLSSLWPSASFAYFNFTIYFSNIDCTAYHGSSNLRTKDVTNNINILSVQNRLSDQNLLVIKHDVRQPDVF